MTTSSITQLSSPTYSGGRRGHDHMVVGFTNTYAISAYRH
jgi:dTDP-D-glucose 4,6-dehydratase